MEKNNVKYNEEMDKLVSLLDSIIKSNEYTVLFERFNDENVLEYGMFGNMKTVKFENLNGESFWEFMYKGICKIEPNSIVEFVNINSFGNIHSSVTIDLNDKVVAMITNRDHKYDKFISTLQDIMKDSEDISEEIYVEKGFALCKRIKPLH